jgi:hypothetical protein
MRFGIQNFRLLEYTKLIRYLKAFWNDHFLKLLFEELHSEFRVLDSDFYSFSTFLQKHASQN